MQEKLNFSYRHHLNPTFTVKPCGVLKVKNALITSVYCVTAVVSFRQHVCTDFAALPTSYAVYTRCYVSRYKGSEREVGHLLLHLHSTMSNPKKITFYCSMHCIILHYLQVSAPIFLWPFAAIYLFMAYCITCFLFFLPSPIICPLIFSFVYIFKAVSLCLKRSFFDKCIYFHFLTYPCVCIFWHY